MLKDGLGIVLGTARRFDKQIIQGKQSSLTEHIRGGEGRGCEPPIGLHLCRISSAVHSTTLPPLLKAPVRSRAPGGWGVNRRGWRVRQGAREENRAGFPTPELAKARR